MGTIDPETGNEGGGGEGGAKEIISFCCRSLLFCYPFVGRCKTQRGWRTVLSCYDM